MLSCCPCRTTSTERDRHEHLEAVPAAELAGARARVPGAPRARHRGARRPDPSRSCIATSVGMRREAGRGRTRSAGPALCRPGRTRAERGQGRAPRLPVGDNPPPPGPPLDVAGRGAASGQGSPQAERAPCPGQGAPGCSMRRGAASSSRRGRVTVTSALSRLRRIQPRSAERGRSSCPAGARAAACLAAWPSRWPWPCRSKPIRAPSPVRRSWAAAGLAAASPRRPTGQGIAVVARAGGSRHEGSPPGALARAGVKVSAQGCPGRRCRPRARGGRARGGRSGRAAGDGPSRRRGRSW
jgi:hypothetical protein